MPEYTVSPVFRALTVQRSPGVISYSPGSNGSHVPHAPPGRARTACEAETASGRIDLESRSCVDPNGAEERRRRRSAAARDEHIDAASTLGGTTAPECHEAKGLPLGLNPLPLLTAL